MPRDRDLPSCPPGDGQFQSPLRWEVVGRNLLAMSVQGPLFLLLTLLLQYRGRLLPRSVGSRVGGRDQGPTWDPLCFCLQTQAEDTATPGRGG